MAGGKLAESVVCMVCFEEGELVRAVRTYEGLEDDHYRCEKGHEFGVDYSRGPLEEPEWPPPPELVRTAESLRRAHRKPGDS